MLFINFVTVERNLLLLLDTLVTRFTFEFSAQRAGLRLVLIIVVSNLYITNTSRGILFCFTLGLGEGKWVEMNGMNRIF